MFRLVFFICLVHWSASLKSQRFLAPKKLASESVSSKIYKPLTITKLAVPNIHSKMFGAAEACNASSICGTLPVTLLSFEGRRLDASRAGCYWKTTHEINVAGYFVERSFTNTSDFVAVGYVQAQQGSKKQKNYAFIDQNVFDGTSYYRLRMTDIDGKFTYSNIVAVKGLFKESIKVYPNPVINNLSLGISINNISSGTITITNALGHVMLQRASNLLKGNNNITFPIGHFAKGVYTVRVLRKIEAPVFTTFVKL